MFSREIRLFSRKNTPAKGRAQSEIFFVHFLISTCCFAPRHAFWDGDFRSRNRGITKRNLRYLQTVLWTHSFPFGFFSNSAGGFSDTIGSASNLADKKQLRTILFLRITLGSKNLVLGTHSFPFEFFAAPRAACLKPWESASFPFLLYDQIRMDGIAPSAIVLFSRPCTLMIPHVNLFVNSHFAQNFA